MGLQKETRSAIHNITTSGKGRQVTVQKLVSVVITVDTVTIFILIWSQLLKFFDDLTQSSPKQNFGGVQ